MTNQDRDHQRQEESFWDAVVEHECFGRSREQATEDAAFRHNTDPYKTRNHFDMNYWG